MTLQRPASTARRRGGRPDNGAWLFGIALGLLLFVATQGMTVGAVVFPWVVAVIIASRLAADIIAGVLLVCLGRTLFFAAKILMARLGLWRWRPAERGSRDP